MLPAALFQQMTAQILLMAPLHHHDLGRRLRIVHSGRHDHIEPVIGGLPHGIRFHFSDVVRVIANDSIPTLAGSGAAHRCRQPVTGAIVKTTLGVLVAGQCKAISHR